MNIFLAIIPVFTIILFGYLIFNFLLNDKKFWEGAEKLTYYIFFPALLVSKMLNANLNDLNLLKLGSLLTVLFIAATILLVLIKFLFNFKNSEFTSIYQGGIRFNTYIGLAILSSLYQDKGLVIGIILAAMMIPLINILSVSILEIYSHGKSDIKKILKSIACNPLILACLIGMGLNISHIPTPLFIQETLSTLASAALPLGLLTVGAALKVKGIQHSLKALSISSTVKFMVLPLLAYYLCQLWEVDIAVQQALIVLTALPTATASYVLSKQLGGDYEFPRT